MLDASWFSDLLNKHFIKIGQVFSEEHGNRRCDVRDISYIVYIIVHIRKHSYL